MAEFKNYLNNAIFSFNDNPFDWIENNIEVAKKNNLKQYSKSQAMDSFYGYDAKSPLSFEEQMDRYVGLAKFENQKLLESVEKFLRNIENLIDLGGNLEKAKIEYSSIPRGIFDFNMASKGLIRPVEYYCEEFGGKLIDPDDVVKRNFNGKDEFYYYFKDEPLYCEPRQDGTTAMLNAYPQQLTKNYDSNLNIYLPYDNYTKELANKFGNLSLRYTSTEKKVYAYRKKLGGGVAPFVDLFGMQGSNAGASGEDMFVQILPMILLAVILERAGVKSRIWIADNYTYDEFAIAHNLLIKEYGESVDINKIGLFSSDKRIFRYLGWNALAGANFKISSDNKKITPSLRVLKNGWGGNGSSLYDYEVREDFVIIKNFYKSYIDEGLISPSQVDKKLMVFAGGDIGQGGKFFTSEGEINETIQKKVLNGFYLTADYVSIQLSKTPARTIANISTRMQREGKSEAERNDYLVRLYKNYMENMQYTAPYDGDNINRIRGSSSKQEIEEGREEKLKVGQIFQEFVPNLKLQEN